jgi:hypothetical protein
MSTQQESESATTLSTSFARGARLVALGFLTIFLELVFIRYLAGTIWNLGYFPNLVLMAVFIGMGLGFALNRLVPDEMAHRLFQVAPFVILLLIGFVYVGRPATPGFTQWAADVGGDLYFTSTPNTAPAAGTYAAFLAWFLVTVAINALISQRTAKMFRTFPPLTAYTLDISGSCCGILLFMLISALHIGAEVWMLLLIPPFLIGLDRASPAAALAVVVPLSLSAVVVHVQDGELAYDRKYAGPKEVYWSPYQKIEYVDPSFTDKTIFVNGVSHQAMFTVDQLSHKPYRAVYDDRAKRTGLGPYRKVMVIGAGSGNDVEMALMHDVGWIDAVEIDPVIQDLGVRHHPAKPYQDSRVHVSIDDGRAFMRRTTPGYDLIVFALTDSLVKVSAVAQLRLENYIYTADSIREAWNLLDEHGDITFYNYYRRPWIVEKLYKMIIEATGRMPRVVWQEDDFVVLVVEKDGAAASLEATAKVVTGDVDPAIDDWPFFYLKNRSIPDLYVIAMSVIAIFILSMLLVMQRVTRVSNVEARARPEELRALRLTFILMGIAFSLLETKSIIQFSLLFGTTWLNTSLVILAVLVSVLAANWTVQLLEARLKLSLVFVLLMVSTAIPFVFPLGRLLGLESAPSRFIAAAVLTFAPVFFANLLFSLAFKPRKEAADLFGWNLFGATLGVVVEYFSMLLGYNALAVFVLIAYALAFVLLLYVGRSPLAGSQT